MGLILDLVDGPSPLLRSSIDRPNDSLAASMDVHMLDRDLLLPFASMTV